jgi:site-specific DNA-methyltransferase (adenine-specific)
MIGDMRERLRELPDNSVDSVVCDPPYHLTSIVKRFSKAKPRNHMHDKHKGDIKAGQYARLSKGFMGQSWDGGDVAFDPATWAEVERVLKPGGHLIAFSGTRTYHRMACAIEDAGFEIRDQLAWVFGSGFPKSHNHGDGWGTALKPAWEPICLARKPVIGTVAGNREVYGTGAINIDACRIEADGEIIEQSGEKVDIARGKTHAGYDRPNATMFRTGKPKERNGPANQQGRWPANLIHDGSDEVVAGFSAETGKSSGGRIGNAGGGNVENLPTGQFTKGDPGFGDSGSTARFFYCAKAATEERGEGNTHPTVKPIDLMRWLVRLVTPKGGTVLDPFMGSGSTLIAADAEQFNAIGCELSAEYAAIAERRIRDAAGMFADVRIAA